MSRFPSLIVLVLTFAASAAAQEDWAPRYVPPQQSQQQPSPPQPAAAPPEPQKLPGKPVREFNDGGSAPAPPQMPAAAPATQTPAPNMTQRAKEMRDVAERFAPVLYQRMAGTAEEQDRKSVV